MEDSRAWKRQLEGLADDFTVYAWDAPGCGHSSDIPETWRFAEFADALAAWLRALDLQRPHVLGLSWGSSLALEFYRRHAEVPASLILASAYAGWAGSLPPAEVAARLSSVLAAADLSREEFSKGWPDFFSRAATPELIGEMMSIAADNSGLVRPGGYRAMAHAMAEADLRDVLPQIRIPTLLIYGELDERSPLHVAGDLHARIPSSVLAVIDGAGHMTNVEAPDEFNARVRRFIHECDAGEARDSVPDPVSVHISRKGAIVISGTFNVVMKPLDTYASGTDGVTLGRMSIDKTFSGSLSAVSKGEMLSARTPVQGSAGYVALEQVTGELDGRKGSFVLQHYGLMGEGGSLLTLEVVPGSGSGELLGLTGKMNIRIENGQHFYDFEYQFADLTSHP